MKSTEAFKKVIREHLEKKALEDTLFNEKFKNEKKNIDDCVTYILNTVKNSGCNGFADDEIFGMAVHYYDEEKIDAGRPISGNVVVNHHVDLTEEEKNEARAIARNKYESEQLQLIKKEEEKKAEKERKQQEKMKEREERKKAEREKKTVMAQQTLF